jgi:hypothetical protein
LPDRAHPPDAVVASIGDVLAALPLTPGQGPSSGTQKPTET